MEYVLTLTAREREFPFKLNQSPFVSLWWLWPDKIPRPIIPHICRPRHPRRGCKIFRVRGVFFPYKTRKEPLWNLVECVLFHTQCVILYTMGIFFPQCLILHTICNYYYNFTHSVNFTQCVIPHEMCDFTQCVVLHTGCNFTHRV